jgi:hypothetical protein
MILRRVAYLSAGFVCIAGSIALSNDPTSATIALDAPHKIAVKATAPPHVVVQSNPFVALQSGRQASVAGSMQPIALAQPIRGNFVDAPVPAPGTAAVPGAYGQSGQQASVVLCDTWPNQGNADGRTPTAVFYVGNESVVAGPGDDVGGYALASVRADSVSFQSGEVLSIGDCSTLGGAQTEAQPQATSTEVHPLIVAPNGDVGPQPLPLYAPLRGPNAQVQGIVPGPNATVAPFAPTREVNGTYGHTGGTYGSTIYGAAPPTTPPAPYYPGQAGYPRPATAPTPAH